MIFIDANIYLDFYSNSQPLFRKLLASVVELGEELIVPQQIVDEVTRNRVKKLCDGFAELQKKAAAHNICLPGQLDGPGIDRVKSWNSKRKQLQDKIADLNNELKGLIWALVEEVQLGRDPVSLELAKVFAKSIDSTQEILTAARNRRERGNPPGKQSDTLGDQLSWETILSRCNDSSDLWFVGRDGNYGVHVDERLYLNAFLLAELLRKSPSKRVYAFTSLAPALKHYAEQHRRPATLPTDSELETIAKEEKQAHPVVSFPGFPEICPRCNRMGAFTGGFAGPSQFGGWSYHVICHVCGLVLDTGEGVDE